MGNRYYDDMAALRRDVEALIDAGRFDFTEHARTDHPELPEEDKLNIIRFGRNDKVDVKSPPSQPRYLCWGSHPLLGRCRAVYAIVDTLVGDQVLIITAFPEG